MKLKTKEFTREVSFLSHLILDCVNKEVINLVSSMPTRDEDTEYDVELKFNGIELDIRKFTFHLEKAWKDAVQNACKPEAEKLFEKMKQDFKTKNSTNAQLNKINMQIEKANNQLKNIKDSIDKVTIL
jgi:hypothetical protein